MFNRKRIVESLLLLIVFVSITSAVVSLWAFFWPLVPAKDNVDLKIKYGTPFEDIARELRDRGIIQSTKRFEIIAKILGRGDEIKAGRYLLPARLSHYAALSILVKGKQNYIKITIPEGSDSRTIAGLLQRDLELDSVKIRSLVCDSTFIAQRGIDAVSLEGYLYPETYHFTYGVTEEQVLTELVHQFFLHIPDSLRSLCGQSGFTFEEMLILASIIEGEAVVDSEMAIISSVYHNRLKIGMRLQADPTIQYIIPDGPRRLLNRDLDIDSPYNTYKFTGLPPGPINNPGKKAFLAALFPESTNYLYFVANGDGSHTFSATLSEHLEAKRRFDVIRQRVARQRGKDRSG